MRNGNGKPHELWSVGVPVDARLIDVYQLQAAPGDSPGGTGLVLRFRCAPGTLTPDPGDLWFLLTDADVEKLASEMRV